MPDPFCIRYKRINYQHTMKANEGSPRTDNALDSRPRDFPRSTNRKIGENIMKMWETKCSGCGKMTPANQTPQVGHQAPDGKWTNSLCKPCWVKKSNG